METLGFRRPQFSEDLAWLPGWAQHQVEQFDEIKNEYLGSSNLKSKVSALFQGNIFTGNDAGVSLKEDSGHNSHHLFLSGEDNSATSFTSSSRNVLQFHLHLSSNGVSQCTPYSIRASDASQTSSELNRVSSMHKFETSVTEKDNILPKVSIGTNGLNIVPRNSSPELRPYHSANRENSNRHSGEKFSRRNLKDAEIKDAVELSISASEALVIHEIVTTRPDSEELVATDPLEVSLQMKQARLQWLEDAFDFSRGIDETDSLSDLDDFAMTDAFEDVGLICCSDEQHETDSAISRVKETPVSENHHKRENHSGSENLPAQQVQKMLETNLNLDGKLRHDFPVEYLDCERQRKLSGNPKMILKAFACETSFLSESADIAPDENSIVQISGINSHVVSPPSVAVEALLDNASNEILCSQDEVKSSSMSLLDPLCSVVPCSLSTEDINTVEAQMHNNVKTDLGSDLRLKVEREMANSSKVSSLDVEIECKEEQVMHMINKGSAAYVKKHMTSLKTCSTFFPSSVSTFDKGILHFNQSFQSQYGCGQFVFSQSMDCVGASDKLSSKHLPLLPSTLKCLHGSENEKLHPNEELNKKNASNDETARDGSDVAVHSPKEGTEPCHLNPTVRCCLRASEPSIVYSSGGGYPEQASGIDDTIRLQSSEKTQSLRPIYKNPHHRISRAKKRVRFSEPEGQIKQNKNVVELSSSGKMCSTKMTSKKIKFSGKSSDYRTCEESSLNCFSNVNKGHLLQGMQFLLTGLSRQNEKDIKGTIQKHGGIILPDIPSPLYSLGGGFLRSNWYQLPIILSTRKQRTAKFLYGCAINTFVLHVEWLNDSIGAGSILPPEQYLILPWQAAHSNTMNQVQKNNNTNGIFEKVGVMLYGKHSFCSKLEMIVKHGGGQVFKTVQRLVQRLNKEKISIGVIVTEDDNMASRHLRQCATEWKIPMMSSSWIIKSLYSGKLLPFAE